MSDDDEALPRIHVITIVLDPDSGRPEIDLGDVPPPNAICFFHQAALVLEELLAPPKISFDGQVIYEIMSQDEG